MLFIISPSKTMDFSSPIPKIGKNLPFFSHESSMLIDICKKLSKEDIKNLMSVSDKISELNYSRFQDFDYNHEKNSRAALFTYHGDVYENIDKFSYTENDLDFANKHMRIISGLYGILKPLDLIQAYRLEMGIKLKSDNSKDLYEFWKNKLTKHISNEISEHSQKVIINLASKEYSSAIDFSKLPSDYINVNFYEKKDGKYKIIGILSKKARGMMADFIIKNKIEKAYDIKNFSKSGYEFSKEMSDEKNWNFIRG